MDSAVASIDPTRPAALTELADRIARLATTDGILGTALPFLHVIRMSQPTPCLPTVCDPRLCIVVQGRKTALMGEREYRYDPLNYLVVSMTVPMIGQIIEASPDRPYLCLRIDIDPDDISRLLLDMAETGATPLPAETDPSAASVAAMTPALLDAVLRLVRQLDEPDPSGVLARLALREILYRILLGEIGHRLRALAVQDSRPQRIARAVQYLRAHYLTPLRVDALARQAHMSTSSLHQHFKAATTLSPLQFQKQLRLHEARRLMLAEGLEAGVAAHRVGYESASQFNREYKRLFGAPPRTEIGQMLGQAQTLAPQRR